MQPDRRESTYQRALERVRGRSIWWFVGLAVLLAFLPVSAPVLLGVYALMAVAFWIPLLRRSGSSFREGYRADPHARDR
jgi:uncharacterized membrane protein YccC